MEHGLIVHRSHLVVGAQAATGLLSETELLDILAGAFGFTDRASARVACVALVADLLVRVEQVGGIQARQILVSAARQALRRVRK